MTNFARGVLGATAVASDPISGDGSEVLDGRPLTYCINTAPGTITIDLGAAHLIQTFALAWINPTWTPSEYYIESAPDNATWTSRYHSTSVSPDPTGQVALTSSATVRYWRLRGVVGPSGGFGPTKVDLLDTVAEALPANLIGPTYVPTFSDAILGGADSNAFDVSESTYVLFPVPGWMRIDFGSTVTIDSFRILCITPGWTSSEFFIESSPDASAWTSRYHTTTFDGEDTGRVIFTPAAARYWRLRGISSVNGGFGPSVFSLFEAVTIPSLEVDLPFLTDGDTLHSPAVIPDLPILLPFLADSDSIFDTAIRPELSVVLAFLADTDGMVAPLVRPDLRLDLPFLDDPDSLFLLQLTFPGLNVILPLLDDLDVIIAPAVVAGPVYVELPLVADDDSLFSPDIGVGPVSVLLPFLVDTDRITAPSLLFTLLTITSAAEDRVWESAGPSPVRYFYSQTVEVRISFSDRLGGASDPLVVAISTQSPDGVESTYTYGVDPEVEKYDTGIYRIQITGTTQHGRWHYRGSGTTGLVTAVAEGSFVIRKSEFEP